MHPFGRTICLAILSFPLGGHWCRVLSYPTLEDVVFQLGYTTTVLRHARLSSSVVDEYV